MPTELFGVVTWEHLEWLPEALRWSCDTAPVKQSDFLFFTVSCMELLPLCVWIAPCSCPALCRPWSLNTSQSRRWSQHSFAVGCQAFALLQAEILLWVQIWMCSHCTKSCHYQGLNLKACWQPCGSFRSSRMAHVVHHPSSFWRSRAGNLHLGTAEATHEDWCSARMEEGMRWGQPENTSVLFEGRAVTCCIHSVSPLAAILLFAEWFSEEEQFGI